MFSYESGLEKKIFFLYISITWLKWWWWWWCWYSPSPSPPTTPLGLLHIKKRKRFFICCCCFDFAIYLPLSHLLPSPPIIFQIQIQFILFWCFVSSLLLLLLLLNLLWLLRWWCLFVCVLWCLVYLVIDRPRYILYIFILKIKLVN